MTSEVLLNHLLPRGDKPLDFALFLAAFDEAGFLTGGFRQTRTQAVWQRVRVGARAGARTQNRPLPQAVATLARTLPNKQKHNNDDTFCHLMLQASAVFMTGKSSDYDAVLFMNIG